MEEELASWQAVECFACCQSALVRAAQAFAGEASVAGRSGEGPSVDREGRWAAAEAGKVQAENRDPEEVRIPCSCHNLVVEVQVEVRIPSHILAPRRAALESHVHRLGPGSVGAAGTDLAAGLGIQTAAVAADYREAAALETGSGSGSVAAAGVARRARVARDAS